MNDYTIITNRKRAIIALVHSVIFLGLALRTLAMGMSVKPVWLAGSAASVGMLTVYFVVSSVLIQLFRISRCARERLYFGFCASSATLGFLRAVFGDPSLPVEQFLRVAMLICAVMAGASILRGHSRVGVVAESEL
jgi:hypothetical protein